MGGRLPSGAAQSTGHGASSQVAPGVSCFGPVAQATALDSPEGLPDSHDRAHFFGVAGLWGILLPCLPRKQFVGCAGCKAFQIGCDGWDVFVFRGPACFAEVFLSAVGGGAFGNRTAWIVDAIGRAMRPHSAELSLGDGEQGLKSGSS